MTVLYDYPEGCVCEIRAGDGPIYKSSIMRDQVVWANSQAKGDHENRQIDQSEYQLVPITDGWIVYHKDKSELQEVIPQPIVLVNQPRGPAQPSIEHIISRAREWKPADDREKMLAGSILQLADVGQGLIGCKRRQLEKKIRYRWTQLERGESHETTDTGRLTMADDSNG
jgi:hypothetical protein